MQVTRKPTILDTASLYGPLIAVRRALTENVDGRQVPAELTDRRLAWALTHQKLIAQEFGVDGYCCEAALRFDLEATWGG